MPPTPANDKVRAYEGAAKPTHLYLFVKLSIHDPQQRIQCLINPFDSLEKCTGEIHRIDKQANFIEIVIKILSI